MKPNHDLPLEHFRHEVPKTKNLRPHPISKDVRINITFRYSRPVYLENNPKCYCGNHSILRTVVKKSNTMGSYFYSCGGKTNSDHSTEQEEEEREIERENGAGQDSQLLLGQKKTSVTVRCDFFQWLDTNHINTLDKQRLLTSQSNP